MPAYLRALIPIVFLGVVAIVTGALMVRIATVRGSELGVMESWTDGVIETPLQPKTYILFPGFMKKVYTYSMATQAFVMNDVTEDRGEISEGRENDAYEVQSKDQQTMRIALSVRWRIDPLKIVEIHRTVRTNLEERLIRPEVMRVVKNEATSRTALEAYAGPGLVALQAAINQQLSDPNGELRERGIIIENFVIEGIRLKKEYTDEIEARQIAIQAALRAQEETKAAQARAERIEAEAQAEARRALVEADRAKQVGILDAQRAAEQQVLAATAEARRVTLAAEAEKNRNVLAAEGDKAAGELRAAAILALGQAEAEAQRLRLQAYAVEGAEGYVQIEVARHMAEAFKNISGYLPGDMNVTLLSDSFLDAIRAVTGARPATVAPRAAPAPARAP